MSGNGNTKHTEDSLTLHPWSGDNGSHEDWEKVLSLKALSLGGNIMYQWVRGEGPEIVPANLDPIGRAIREPIEDHVQGRCWRRSLAQVGRKREVARLQVCYRWSHRRSRVMPSTAGSRSRTMYRGAASETEAPGSSGSLAQPGQHTHGVREGRAPRGSTALARAGSR